MELEENRREKPPGRAIRGGGKACHRCGWVYPNPRPSKKHRNAHRKHCVAAAPASKALDVDVAGANGDPGNNGEVVVEKLKSEGEERKEMGQSGGTGAELSQDVIWESDVVESYPESHVQHHDINVQISAEESTLRQVRDSARSENHSRAVDKVCANEEMEGSQCPFTEGSCEYALMDEINSGAVLYKATVTNNTSNGTYEDTSELTDSEIQKMDELMEFSGTADQANTITTAVEGEAVVEEKKQVSKEKISYVHPNNGFPPAMYTTEFESPLRDEYFDGTSKVQLNRADAQDTREEIFKQSGVVDGIIQVSAKQEEHLFNEAIADNLYETLDPYKSENAGTIHVSRLDLQNDFEVGSGNPVSIDMNNPSDIFVREIDQTINFGKENVPPTILQNEENSNGNQVDNGNLRNIECSTSKVVASFDEKLASYYVSKTSNTPGVATSIFYQSSEEEDANDKAIQQSNFHIRKIDESTSSNSLTEHETDPCTGKTDDSFCSNNQTCHKNGGRLGSIEARWAHFSGENAVLRNEEVEPNFAPIASTPTNSQAREHLSTSNPTTEGALVENSSEVIVSRMSIGNKSAYTSIHESERRNINEETSPNELNWDSRKSHVMLRNLFDEANLESKQTVTNGQGQKESLRKNWGLQYVGQSIKTATSKVVYDRCKVPSTNQAAGRNWNSFAGLTVTKRGKKAKGKQGWVPFICCQSMV